MGDVVVSEFVTLDGVFEDPGGSESSQWGGWAFRFDRGPEGDKFKVEETLNAGAMLLGRKTYDGFAEAWPGRSEVDGDLLVAGSATLVGTLLKYQLVDELRLMVFPAVLGGGRRLFSDGNATAAFELVDCRPAAQCAILVYRRPRV
jgi:dihydrofolate reductase